MEQAPQDNIIEKFKRDVEATFPNIPITEWGYGFDFHVGFGSSNSVLRKSEYFHDSSKQRYFHLTSYRNLFSIVNSGKLRLYNLSNSDDANELNSYKDVGFTQEQIDRRKEDIFIFSFCKEADIDNKKLWQDYGKVAVVFEIINEPSSWSHFHLSEVKYKTNPSFKRYFELLQAFQRDYKGVIFSHETLRDLIAFHKINTLDWEREIRLMYLPSMYHTHYDQYQDFKTSKHHTGFTKYIELPLYVEPDRENEWRHLREMKVRHNLDETYFADKPLIKIIGVRFGDNEELMDQEKFSSLYQRVRHYLLERLGYSIGVDPKLFVTGVPAKAGT